MLDELAVATAYVEHLRREEQLGGLDTEWARYAFCVRGYRDDLPLVHPDCAIQAHYVAMRLDGESHAFAEMLALQTPPQANSDREFLMAQRQGKDSQFSGDSWRGNYYRQRAEAAGVNVTGGNYMPGLARFPGDPEAWIWGKGDVQRVVEERGWSCEGALNIAAREPETPPMLKAEPAADIVYERCLNMIAANPDLQAVAETKPRELFDKARESLKPDWSKVNLPVE